MFPHLLLTSGNATLFYAVTPFMQFTVLLCIALVVFIIAVARQTLIANVLSAVLWFGLGFFVWAVSDPTSGLTQGSSALFFALGFISMLLAVKSAADLLAESAREKQRRMEEEIIL